LPSNALAGLRILLLEDEYLIAMDVEMLCRDHGAADVIIRHGIDDFGPDENLDGFDVAVIDLMLSGVSTRPFAERLQGMNRPFVFASGYVDDETMAAFPGVRVVSKPYAADDLIEAIAEAVGRR
jgi:CheY-like chemotaxis protein